MTNSKSKQPVNYLCDPVDINFNTDDYYTKAEIEKLKFGEVWGP